MNNNDKNQPVYLNRRQFLGQASCAALGTTGLFSTLLNLRLTRAATAAELLPGNDYKALVCIFQAGGHDSYNMLVPTTTADYNQYAAARSDLALKKAFDASMPLQSGILDLNALGTGGRTFGVHPAMKELQQIFNEGNLAFIANTGTMIEPMTVAQYKNNSRRIPPALFSHSDQIMQWQTSVPQQNPGTGWAGRMSDLLHVQASGMSNVSMNISLSGNNIWQTGENTSHYTITPNGSVSLLGKNSGASSLRGMQYNIVGSDDEDENSLAGQMYRNLFEKSYMEEFRESVALDQAFASAFAGSNITTQFDGSNPLAKNLKAVARTIAARNELNVRRQVFFVIAGGWDHHNELIETQYGMLRGVSSAMKQFWDALKEMGVQDDVVTFTASDFGRTLRSNGRGTDHAWGGNHMVMGGAVHGQRIWGQYPTAAEMRVGSGLDVGTNGRLLPTTSVDEYMAELALWFGVPASSLPDVFPNLTNFYNPTSGGVPIGFIGCATGSGSGSTGINCTSSGVVATFTHPSKNYNGSSGDTITHGAALDVAANNRDFSVEFCIKPEQGPTGQWRAIIHKGKNNEERTFALWFRPNDMRLHYRISTTDNWNTGGDGRTALPLNATSKITYVRAGNKLKLYVNGVLDSETTVRGTVRSNTGPLYIGDSPWYGGTKGQIGKFTIYNGAITPTVGNCSLSTPTFTHPTKSYNGSSGDTIPHSAALDVAANNRDFSMEFCIKPEQGPTGQWRAIVHKGGSNSERTFAMWFRPNDMRLHYRISTSANRNTGGDGRTALPLNETSKVTYIRQGNKLKLYVNGVLDSETTISGTVLSNTGPLHIGDSPWYGGTKGRIGDFSVYDTVITPTTTACDLG